MCILTIHNVEHLVSENTVAYQKVVKLFGMPIFIRYTETSNYNYVGQFDPNNFTNTVEKKDIPLYTETHIGFANEENTKTSSTETIEQSNKRKTSV